MKQHAKLSPSAAGRWLQCTASATVEQNYENESTSYAEEGTFAHSLAELCTKYALKLITKSEYKKQLAIMGENDFFNQEMLDYCEDYAAYIKEKFYSLKRKCPDAFVELEVRLDLTSIIPEGFGTADCIIVAEPKMWVIDFKYGKGVKVEAEGNIQMEIYGLGAMAKYKVLYDIQRVGMAIVQPRLGGISETEIDAGALRAWGSIHIIPHAKEAYEGPGHFRPSEEACRFCKARKDCKARANYFMKIYDDHPFDEFMTPEEAGEILEKAAGIENWLKDLREKVFEALSAGQSITGWKLVEGKSNRKFTDEKEVAAILEAETDMTRDEIFKTKLVGISEIEKKLGKKKTAELLGELIVKPKGEPKLAPANDKRPDINPYEDVINAFDE